MVSPTAAFVWRREGQPLPYGMGGVKDGRPQGPPLRNGWGGGRRGGLEAAPAEEPGKEKKNPGEAGPPQGEGDRCDGCRAQMEPYSMQRL